MREQARIVLAIIRKANEQHVLLDLATMRLFHEVLGTTEHELLEIGEILKADAREQFIDSPSWPWMSRIIDAFPKIP